METEPQEQGYFMNEEDGATKYELPRLKQQLDQVRGTVADLCQEWDGTKIEPEVWPVVLALFDAVKKVEDEMTRLGITLRSAGLG
jgi:hypothetical protein